MSFEYDREADALYISRCKPYPEEESEELEEGLLARFNPETREIENLELMFFSTRLLRSGFFEIPVIAQFRSISVS